MAVIEQTGVLSTAENKTLTARIHASQNYNGVIKTLVHKDFGGMLEPTIIGNTLTIKSGMFSIDGFTGIIPNDVSFTLPVDNNYFYNCYVKIDLKSNDVKVVLDYSLSKLTPPQMNLQLNPTGASTMSIFTFNRFGGAFINQSDVRTFGVNINELEKRVLDLEPTTLWIGNVSSGNITAIDDFANYKRLRVWSSIDCYVDCTVSYNKTWVQGGGTGQNVGLTSGYHFIFYKFRASISGKIMGIDTSNAQGFWWQGFSSGTGTNGSGTISRLNIIKIEGFKY